MIRWRVIPVIASLILSPANAFAQLPSDAEIRKILADRVYRQDLGIGIVVGDVLMPLVDDIGPHLLNRNDRLSKGSPFDGK